MSTRSNRSKVAEDLFKNLHAGVPVNKAVTQGTIRPNEGLKSKFLRLERLRKSEIAKWWDGATLKEYLRLERVPRDLRSTIFPTYDDLEEDLLLIWEKELIGNSMRLMNILIESADRKVLKAIEEIDILEKEILDMNLVDVTKKNYTILEEILGKFEDDIKERKARKLKRDEIDYLSGRVFTFAKKFDSLVRNDLQRKGSKSSIISGLSGASSSTTSISEDTRQEGASGSNVPNTFLREVQLIRMGNKDSNARQREEARGNPKEGGGAGTNPRMREGMETRSWNRNKQ